MKDRIIILRFEKPADATNFARETTHRPVPGLLEAQLISDYPLHQTLPPAGAPIPVRPGGVTDADWEAHVPIKWLVGMGAGGIYRQESLTLSVFAKIEADVEDHQLVLHLPRELAKPIFAAARLAFDAGLAKYHSEMTLTTTLAPTPKELK